MFLDALTALVTLTAMEIVLGIDNIVFIAILVAKLPPQEQAKARSLGISLALIFRLGLLFSITWVMSLVEPIFSIFDKAISGRDLILIGGGLFLIAKATFELHEKLEVVPKEETLRTQPRAGFGILLVQIVLIDMVFSLDSVITAVGMAQQIWIMVVAIILAVGVMLVSSSQISRFVEKHPTIKVLALSFLLLIGVMLLVEGMGAHVSKAYVYFAMGFSLGVEFLNMRYRKNRLSA
jgi:predicted tellurium resistance membrane protein TerC